MFNVHSNQSSTPNSQSPVSYTPKHLVERILAEQAAMEARGAFAGERKTITALFADIQNSMALIEDLDPEEARAIIDPMLQLMMEAVHQYDGYVSQSMGDGIFALFGAPIACEDHPQRAIFAALRMQEAGKRYAEVLRREKGVNVQIRVGLNTGEVVVRAIHKDNLHTDYTPVGYATSLAARMESLATPGSILISAHTHQLVEGYFECQSLGPTRIKGVSEPLPIYEVLGPGPLRTRLQVAARRGLARFIGRQAEWRQLKQALEQTKNGQGCIVGMQGAPGVGKSRLFHEFKVKAASGCLVLETFSVSHGKAYAYLPLIELLKSYFQITVQDDERKRREKITGKVLTLDRGLEDTLPYLFALLGVEEANSPLPQLDSQIRRRRTFGAVVRLLFHESLNQPLILICEDLHWIDEETQAFLLSQTEQIASARILLLVNFRPEYQNKWLGKPYYVHLQLEPLGRQEAKELLSILLGERENTVQEYSLLQLKRQILEKTEGNPLFMEEIIRALVEQHMLIRDTAEERLRPTPTINLASLHLPPTIQGVLAARIDRLSPDAKELLQTSSVIGKEFSLNLLAKVAKHSEDARHQLLLLLQNAGFLHPQPTAVEVVYSFAHALTHEVAYTSLLFEHRRALHEHLAQAIEELFPHQLAEHYSALAHHYSQSGNVQKALQYLHLAGEQAVQRSANTEAIRHFTAALELLNVLPATAERDAQELALRLALGVPLVITAGIAAPDVGETYTRALTLAQQSGDTALLFPVLRGLWEFYEVRSALAKARTLGEKLLTLARQTQNSTLFLIAHGALADTLLWHGDFARAREHAEQGVAAYAPAQHHSLAFLYGGHDLGVSSSVWRALALWQLGYPDQAVLSIHEALPVLETLAHPYSTVHTLSFASILHQFLRQERAVHERVAAALMLSQEQRFTQYVAMQIILHGWVLTEQGQEEKGIVRINEGLAIWRETYAELFLPYYHALLAEAYGKVGRATEGIALLDEALARVHNSEERWWEAELYRLKGELLLKSSVKRERKSL
ncbi:MAG: adenylate/guanylate cyclase domain-containing protein [Candidatus Binatia bacterium]